MILKEILKRDGSKENFAPYKIEDAIKAAFKSQNTQYDSTIFFHVLERLKTKRIAAVEDIQDMIEQELFKGRYFDVMRAFMIYRHTHKMQRSRPIFSKTG